MTKQGDIICLEKIISTLKSVSKESWTDFAEACQCIQIESASSGRGLSTGEKIDFFLTRQFLPEHLGSKFQDFHEFEADFKIASYPVSFKSLKTSGELALCWSRNDGTGNNKDTKVCNHWQVPVMIYIRETERWWKSGPKSKWDDKSKPFDKSEKDKWCEKIEAGFYLINHLDGRSIPLKTNNKSSCILHKQEVYKLLRGSKANGLFIGLPQATGLYNKMKFVFFYEHGENID